MSCLFVLLGFITLDTKCLKLEFSNQNNLKGDTLTLTLENSFLYTVDDNITTRKIIYRLTD